jgi:adenine/guanine phosphoribosyltransferase-like PRPP-binding protein
MQSYNANIVAAVFFIELGFLEGRSKIERFAPIHSVIHY